MAGRDEVRHGDGEQARFLPHEYEIVDIDGVRVLFPDGWGLIRPSNAQPVLVMRFEAETQKRLEEIKKLVTDKVKEYMPGMTI